MQKIINEGDSLVVCERGDKSSFIRAKGNGKLKVGKSFLPMAPIIGAPFGSSFQVSGDGKSLIRCDSPMGDYDVTVVQDTEKDNSSLFDRNTSNQMLGQEEIEALKKSGKSGSEIVQELVSNSKTFENKTEFSQDKYKRKKAKKYVIFVTIREPTARAVCQAYYDKGPERVFNLRVDTLAVALNLANVAAGGKVLLFDNCMGVVAGAVLERMGGLGTLCTSYVDRPYGADAVRTMNLGREELSVLHANVPLAALKAAAAARLMEAEKEEGRVAVEGNNNLQRGNVAVGAVTEMVVATPAAGALPSSSMMELEVSGPAEEPHTSTAPTVTAAGITEVAEVVVEVASATGLVASGVQQTPTASPNAAGPSKGASADGLPSRPPSSLHPTGFTSCIIAAPKLSATSLLSQVLPLLAPSAALVVFSPWSQPLAECMHSLQESRQAVMLQLHESWMRPHQVLPMRTHPQMMCSGTGGFILSGFKVLGGAGHLPEGTAPDSNKRVRFK